MKARIGITVLLFMAATASFADPKFEGAKYAKQAHMSLQEARTIALKTYPGTIIAQELEKEKGGSGLRYSFDIRNGKTTHEVGVDAKDGKVLEDSVEGPHAD